MQVLFGTILQIHYVLGMMILPLLIVGTGVWLTVTWKPDRGRTVIGRIFVWSVAVQFVLGFIIWSYGLIGGNQLYLSWPFILHPLLGLLAVGLASAAVYQRPSSPLRKLGRWAPLAAMVVLFLLVTASIWTGLQN